MEYGRHTAVWVMVALLGVAVIFVWQTAIGNTEDGILSVTFLDVGQGDATLVEAPNGNQILIDGGKGRIVLRALSKELSFFDRTIDVVLATHPDMDHIGGLPDVLKRYTVHTLFEPGVHDDGADYQALVAAVQTSNTATKLARAGSVISIDEDVHLHILFPDRDVSDVEANTGSVVARLVYGDTSFLFTGDAPVAIERHLIAVWGRGLKSDVLKLGHHGSRTSTSEEFLGFVGPAYAVASASCDNTYGHPHTDITERLARFNIPLLDTCTNGTGRFESDGAIVVPK